MRKALPEDFSGLAQVQVDSYRKNYTSIIPGSSLAQFTDQEQEGDWRGCPSVMLWTVQENPAQSWYEKVGGKSLAKSTPPSTIGILWRLPMVGIH